MYVFLDSSKNHELPLKPTFMKEYLEERPFCKYNWDVLIAKLSKLYDLVRTTGHPVQGDSMIVRFSTFHDLPLFAVFNAEKEFEPKDAAITLIYFDDENLEPYLGRLERTMGVEAICLRWYGDMDMKTVCVLTWFIKVALNIVP
ncbi:hypothetical protein BDR07DRAFT_1495667 [Suillus spraguei]|nr:hypothetical protein BDR07DRAFT_1495667 [Suillus spraguei]